MKEIIVATGNKGKLKEIKEILDGLPYNLVPMDQVWNPLPVINEDGETFLENALKKADWVYSHSGIWSLADDSGLEVDALDGAPGVRSARFAGLQGDCDSNNKKLLLAMQDVEPKKRTARFKCVLVLKTGADTYISAEGACEGHIGLELKGNAGFGYDPLFTPVGENETFAQLPSEKKHLLSHRGKAIRILREKINEMSE